jgi:hypothetical protein
LSSDIQSVASGIHEQEIQSFRQRISLHRDRLPWQAHRRCILLARRWYD